MRFIWHILFLLLSSSYIYPMDSWDIHNEPSDERELAIVPTLSDFCLSKLGQQKNSMRLFRSLVGKPVPPPDKLYDLACQIVRYSPRSKNSKRAIKLLHIFVKIYPEYVHSFLNFTGPVIIESETLKQQGKIPSLFFDPTKVRKQVERSLKNEFRIINDEYHTLLKPFFLAEQTKFSINYFQEKLRFDVTESSRELKSQIKILSVSRKQKSILLHNVNEYDCMLIRALTAIFYCFGPLSLPFYVLFALFTSYYMSLI